MNEKVKETEKDLKVLKSDATTLKLQIKDLQACTKELAARMEDQEGRSRRNNIRIVGVPEKAEGHTTDIFVEKLITEGLQPLRHFKIFLC